MSSAGCGRPAHSAASSIALLQLLILLVSLLHVWAFCCDCRADAIRLPAPEAAETPPPGGRREELLQKYFGGRSVYFDFRNQQGRLEESKRRVPSCPDPLHN